MPRLWHDWTKPKPFLSQLMPVTRTWSRWWCAGWWWHTVTCMCTWGLPSPVMALFRLPLRKANSKIPHVLKFVSFVKKDFWKSAFSRRRSRHYWCKEASDGLELTLSLCLNCTAGVKQSLGVSRSTCNGVCHVEAGCPLSKTWSNSSNTNFSVIHDKRQPTTMMIFRICNEHIVTGRPVREFLTNNATGLGGARNL